MKRMKKFMSLALAAVMTFGMTISAMAVEGETGDGTQQSGSGMVGALTPDGQVSVTGIDPGDVVQLYQIIKWDNGNWALNHAIPGITVDDLTNNGNNTDGISLEEAVAIAKVPGTPIEIDGSNQTTVGANGIFTASVEPGMYLVLIADKNNDTIYNPIFVSSDYETSNGTHLIALNNASLIGENGSVAKKEDLTLDKEIDYTAVPSTDGDTTDKNSVAPGDVVPFIVTSNVPTYADNYTNPTYSITDKLSEGITMSEEQQEDISVTVEGHTLTKKTTEDDAWDYEITNVTGKGYTVSFSERFLKGVHGNPKVTIKYAATIDALAEGEVLQNVERFTNDVTLTFSNNPTDQNSHGTRDDQTNHYTFSIDAGLNGSNSGGEVTKELIKVGVDSEGNMLTAWTTSDETKWVNIQPLEGATFKLVGGPNDKEYFATSDKDGYINFNGLDAGDYTLTEETAPAGYVKDGGSYPVKIEAFYKDVKDTKDGSITKVLDYYTVNINGNQSKYTITNSGTDAEITEVEVDNTSMTTPINNIKGVTLPSTGGIGTTIFYVTGGVLVLAAVVLLVTKKRMSAEK